ncbi:hypothetical protein BDQ17DRAFT_1350190, partial [Cyathus striatus]
MAVSVLPIPLLRSKTLMYTPPPHLLPPRIFFTRQQRLSRPVSVSTPRPPQLTQAEPYGIPLSISGARVFRRARKRLSHPWAMVTEHVPSASHHQVPVVFAPTIPLFTTFSILDVDIRMAPPPTIPSSFAWSPAVPSTSAANLSSWRNPLAASSFLQLIPTKS